MKNRGEHALRNATLSRKLHEEGVYYDWVITTAFYSAIHYVENHIFPCQVRGQTCNDINDVKRAYSQRGRHAARERLVFDQLSEVAFLYKWLDDQSRNARYKSFKIRKDIAEKALNYLGKIQESTSDN